MNITKEEALDIKARLDKISDENKKIMFYLYNDANTGKRGLVQQFDDLNKRIDNLTEDVDKLVVARKIDKAKERVWTMVLGAIGGALLYIGKALINFFF